MASWPRCCAWFNLSGKKASRKASLYIKHIHEFDDDGPPATAVWDYSEKIRNPSNSSSTDSDGNVVSSVIGEGIGATNAEMTSQYEKYNNMDTNSAADVVLRQKEPQKTIKRDYSSYNGDANSVSSAGNSVRSPVNSILKVTTQKPPHELKHDQLLPATKSPIQILLVFTQFDSPAETLKRAGERLGFDVTYCDSYDSALEEFQSKSHDLIFVDTRITKLDYDTLCRSIRNTKGNQSVAMVAVTKKGAFEKDEVTIPSLLDSGFNRCIVETTNVSQWVNELIQLKHGDIRLLAQQSTTQALYAALDKCRDVVIITDEAARMQYVNSSAESSIGFRYEELLGKTLQEQLITEPYQVNVMIAKLSRGRHWSGHLTLKRKTNESVTVMCQGIPINCAGRIPTHYVLVIDSGTISIDQQQPKGSVTVPRKGSLDIRSVSSDYNRRISLAKLATLPLEAPITKVINLIVQAQESAGNNNHLVAILDKVVEMLRCTELYAPQMKEDTKMKVEEPVATDLIGALLSQGNQPQPSFSSRRSSNDSSVYRVSSSKALSKIKIPTQIRDLLDHALAWDFDIIRLEDLSNKHPLLYLGITLLIHFDVPNTLNCDERTLYNFLILVESKYHSDNSYHNSTHAADVMQAVAGYLERDRMKAIMDPLDEATALIAAACHDIDHPGRSSAFLTNCDSPLAILYNDITVLESHHAALTFKITLGDDRVNIFKNLDRDMYKLARQNIVDMILATEMTKHFEHLAKFVNVFSVKSSITVVDNDEIQGDYVPIALPENILLVKRMMIKCADVSNPTRPLRLCVEWARRITEEYFQQTDEEKAKGLPVLMPMFDRTTCSVPKAQIGFVDFIINDMVEAWNGFIDFPELVTYMRQNYLKWKEYDERGYTTLTDIKKLQITVLSPTNSTPSVAE